jgi:probable selenium-dependent hydroxylase accessory protein YqeC
MERAGNLISALGLGPREHIAVVGAGGKTTLLFALSGELRGIGRRVLASTTTKVWQREAQGADSVLLIGSSDSWRDALRKDLEEGRSVFLGLRTLESGKVEGVDPSLLDGLYEKGEVEHLIVEADGAAGHPVKAPSGNEPVVPDTATMVVALMGVEVLGAPFTPATVFRTDVFERITRIAPGEVMKSRPLSSIFLHPDGLFRSAPGPSRKVVLFNKADLVHDREEAKEISRLILEDRSMRVERVVVGSLKKGGWEVHVREG